MNRATFESMIGKIMAMFGRNPSQAMNGVCWDVCAELPDIFADYAVDQARDLDKMPGNLSKFLRDSWFRWREANPNRCAKDEAPRGCSRCTNGRIWYLRQDESGRWTPCVATCAHCMAKSNGNTIPWLRISDIERHGGEWIEEGRALAECAKRNGATGNARGGGCDMVGTLQAWKGGQAPYERCPTPDDDRPDLAEGW